MTKILTASGFCYLNDAGELQINTAMVLIVATGCALAGWLA